MTSAPGPRGKRGSGVKPTSAVPASGSSDATSDPYPAGATAPTIEDFVGVVEAFRDDMASVARLLAVISDRQEMIMRHLGISVPSEPQITEGPSGFKPNLRQAALLRITSDDLENLSDRKLEGAVKEALREAFPEASESEIEAAVAYVYCEGPDPLAQAAENAQELCYSLAREMLSREADPRDEENERLFLRRLNRLPKSGQLSDNQVHVAAYLGVDRADKADKEAKNA